MIHITNMKATVGEIQRTYLYKLILISVPTAVQTKASAAYAVYKDNIDIFNQKGIWPQRKTDAIEIKFGGESCYYAGVDASTKDGTLEFLDDEAGNTRSFWNACKDMTGEPEHQVAQVKLGNTLTLGVARVDVTKSKITAFRTLEDVQVFDVSEDDPDKTGNKQNTIKVGIRWDRNLPDTNNSYVGKSA